MGSTLQDLRFAARAFSRHPGFVAGSILTLALGIGANTALFSVVYGVLLKPLPFPEPERLVMLWEDNPEAGLIRAQASPANFLDWRETPGVFTDLTAYSEHPLELTLTGQEQPQAVQGLPVYGNFFDVLGVAPLWGRGFLEEESWAGASPVVVLSYQMWQRLGGDPGLVGKTLLLDGTGRTVAGVMPEGFSFPIADLDLWVPIKWRPQQIQSPSFRQAHNLRPVGRLEPGLSLDEARLRLQAVAARLETTYPETNRGLAAGLTPLREWISGDTRRPLLFLFGAVGLVLLIACSNVANLQLARALGRSQEVALREALGAGRSRLARQFLTESLLLSAAGGAVGLLAGIAGTRLLLVLAPDALAALPRAGEVGLNAAVVTFSAVLSLATGLLFGIFPARRAARARGASLLQGSRATQDSSGRRTRNALVIAEVAVTMVLLSGGALLTRSFLALRNVDPGFSSQGVLTARLSLPPARYREQPVRDAFFQRLLERVQALPGVGSAALVDSVPLTGLSWTGEVVIEGRPARPGNQEFHHRVVSSEYFRVLRVPVLLGRGFTRNEGQGGTGAVIVNQSFVGRYLPDQDPLGRRVRFDRQGISDSGWCNIVGVVGDERVEGFAVPPRPEILEPYLQDSPWSMTLLVRLAGGLEETDLGPLLASEVRALDSDLPLTAVAPFESLIADSLSRERFLAMLMGFFAALAGSIAMVGVFAVTSYNVTRRTREIGIRIALGARQAEAVATLVREMIPLVLAGVALGLAGALAVSRLLQRMLYQTSATDLPTLAAASLVLTLAALAAILLPAARSARIDPMICLRQD